MRSRLIIAIVSTAAEEAAIIFLGLWLLPNVGVHIPVLVLAAVMLVWLGWSVFTYRKGTRALKQTPVRGLIDMKGMNGTVVRALRPEGMVKIEGELWNARSVTGRIEAGCNVAVVSQEGLKLLVREAESGGGSAPVDD